MPRVHRLLPWILLGATPLLLLVLLRRGTLPDPAWVVPMFHFYVVSFTLLIAAVIAVFIALSASQLHDARVLFQALGFLGIAGILGTHGLTTPGALVPGPNIWVGISAPLSVLVGAIFFALSSADWPVHVQRAIMRRQWTITGLFSAGLLAYTVFAIVDSFRGHPVGAASDGGYGSSGGYGEYGEYAAAAVHDHAELSPVIFWGLSLTTLVLLGIVVVRYARLYRVISTPLVAGFLASAIVTMQAQIFMVTTPVWHLSWWGYHLLLIVALGAACLGLLREYGRSGSLEGVVQGLLLRETIAEVERGYTDVIVALVGAVEAKDPYTHGHTQRVAELSLLIGQELRLSPARLRTLEQAAMLHDIGKIGIPDSILNKPGPLTAEEFAIVKEHPVRGHQIIKDIPSLQAEISGVRHHHERLDGSGYPDGLRGDEISLEARIIAVADVYDAVTSARSYRPAWSPERALDLLDEQAGTLLDRQCVQALRRVLPTWHAADRAPEGIGEPVLA